jgi:hypothetical protein
VAELVDAQVLETCVERREGSSPFWGTFWKSWAGQVALACLENKNPLSWARFEYGDFRMLVIWQSGQLRQTVNLFSLEYGGSNPSIITFWE